MYSIGIVYYRSFCWTTVSLIYTHIALHMLMHVHVFSINVLSVHHFIFNYQQFVLGSDGQFVTIETRRSKTLDVNYFSHHIFIHM